MPANKSQHFVPRFHLRHFSNDSKPLNKRRFVSLCLLKTSEVCRNASIACQCQRDYLYGADGIKEDALKKLETHWATFIGDFLEARRVPSLMSEVHWIFLAYVAIQRGRTLAERAGT